MNIFKNAELAIPHIVIEWLLTWATVVALAVGIVALFSAFMWAISRVPYKLFISGVIIVLIAALGWISWLMVQP